MALLTDEEASWLWRLLRPSVQQDANPEPPSGKEGKASQCTVPEEVESRKEAATKERRSSTCLSWAPPPPRVHACAKTSFSVSTGVAAQGT